MAPNKSPKQSNHNGKKQRTTKGSSQATTTTDLKQSLLIAIVVVYGIAFAIGCIPFFLAHYSSVHLSDNSRLRAPESSVSGTVTVTVEETSGRITHHTAPIVPVASLPPATMQALQRHMENTPPPRRPSTDDIQQPKTPIAVEYGRVEGVLYYRCRNNKVQASSGGHDMVILDGGSFLSPGHFRRTENNEEVVATTATTPYHEGTFLELCDAGFAAGVTTVVALDTADAATTETDTVDPTLLWRILQSLQVALPLAAIITPRQSSATMVEWILQQQQTDPPQNQDIAQHWIPVVPQWDEDKSHGLLLGHNNNNSSHWPAVLAVHGATAASSAEQLLLRQTMAATTHALPGGDDCYLEHPKAFAATIMEYLVRTEALPGTTVAAASTTTRGPQLPMEQHQQHFHIMTSTNLFSAL